MLPVLGNFTSMARQGHRAYRFATTAQRTYKPVVASMPKLGRDLTLNKTPFVRSNPVRVEPSNVKRFKVDDVVDAVPDYTGRHIDQNLLNDIVFKDSVLKNVNLTEYPIFNPSLKSLGEVKLMRGGSSSQIGPRAFSSRSEIIDTILHEDLHIRLFNRNRTFDSIDAEEAYIEAVTERFRKMKGL